jgi:hypothetical protein
MCQPHCAADQAPKLEYVAPRPACDAVCRAISRVGRACDRLAYDLLWVIRRGKTGSRSERVTIFQPSSRTTSTRCTPSDCSVESSRDGLGNAKGGVNGAAPVVRAAVIDVESVVVCAEDDADIEAPPAALVVRPTRRHGSGVPVASASAIASPRAAAARIQRESLLHTPNGSAIE